MRRFPVLLLVAALSASTAAAQDLPLVVGSARAALGTTVIGAIEVPAGSDAGLSMPVIVIRGAKPGKTVAFVAGSHGTEYASIVALQRLAPKIDPKTLVGSVIIAPLLNTASFEQMTVHTNPVDKKGMNANYPGNASGTQSERALALVTEQVVKPSDVIVDLHGGDMDEDLRPFSYWFRTGNDAQDKAADALVRAFGLSHVILRDIDTADPKSTRSLSGYSLAQGKTTIVAEAGRSGLVLDEDVNALIEGSLNVLGSLRMIPRSVTPLAKPTYVGAGARAQAAGPGMFFAKVERDVLVKEGDVIGETTDYAGRPTGQIKAPTTGLVTFIRGVPSMWKDATLANVSPVLTEIPAYAKPQPLP